MGTLVAILAILAAIGVLLFGMYCLMEVAAYDPDDAEE